MIGRCDSCGREHEEVVAVLRVYIVPERWDQPGSRTVMPDREHWCFPCRTHYPHELIDEARGADRTP